MCYPEFIKRTKFARKNKDKKAFMADLSEEQIKDMSRRYNEYKFKNRKKGFG